MEFLITPVHRGNPPIPVPQTPCASLERYDLGPWMSYPARNGFAAAEGYNTKSFDLTVHHRSQRINLIPVKDLEAFYQRWLYFGLIAEFVGINSTVDSDEGNETLERIYQALLVEDGGETCVRLDSACFQEFLAIGRANMPPELAARRARHKRLISCLAYAYPILTSLPRTSITLLNAQ
jgi:hypothetical protein